MILPWKTRSRSAGLPALSLLGAALGFCASAVAEVSDRAGTAEFQYLETLIFARPAGLAGAYTSLSQGEDAVGYNPAGLSRLESQRSVSGTFRYHFAEVASGNVTYVFPGAHGTNYAFSAAYVNYGRIEGLDETGNPTGQTHMPNSFNPSFTASRRMSDKVRLGATLKGLSEYLGDFEGSQPGLGVGVDAGLLYQPAAKNRGFGVSLLNLGTKLASQWEGGETGGLLPASLKAGFFYHPLDLPKGRLALDLEAPWHDVPLLSGGLEYAYSPAFTLRGGTRFSWEEIRHWVLKATDQKSGDLEGGNALKLAGGFTVQAEGIGLDYAAQYWQGLSWVHALTFRYAVM